jgi:hypothetical protein
VHLSRSQKEGWSVLNCDYKENKGEKWKMQTAICQVMGGVFWDSEGILLVKFLERCHDQFRAICADIIEVKMNLKGSVKQMNQVLIAS